MSKQQLLTLRADLTDRATKAKAAEQSISELTQRIRQLRGQQIIDEVDHSKLLGRLETELTGAQETVSNFPLAAEELRRRIGEIEQSIAAERLAGSAKRYQELTTTEAQQRREFAQAVVQLATVAKALRGTIDERQQLYSSVIPSVLPMPVGGRPSNHLPAVRVEWFTTGAVDEAKTALAKELS